MHQTNNLSNRPYIKFKIQITQGWHYMLKIDAHHTSRPCIHWKVQGRHSSFKKIFNSTQHMSTQIIGHTHNYDLSKKYNHHK